MKRLLYMRRLQLSLKIVKIVFSTGHRYLLSYFKAHFYWRHLLVITPVSATRDCACLGHLGWYNIAGKYHCTIDLLFDWFGISCMTTDNFCFYLHNRLIQTSQTGGQWFTDTSPFSNPWTQIGSFLLAKASKEGDIVPWYRWCYCQWNRSIQKT